MLITYILTMLALLEVCFFPITTLFIVVLTCFQGMRISLYNAITEEQVDKLITFLKKFTAETEA